MQNGVCAIIVTYNIGKDVLKCFNSVKEQVEEVVFVDNGSDGDTVSILGDIENNYSNIRIFYNDQNMGIAAAFNIAVRYAKEKKYKRILLLDHDSEATPGMVDNLLEAYKVLAEKGIDKIAIVAANAFDKNVQRFIACQKLFSDGGEIKEVKNSLSAGSLVNTEVFEKVGLFNEALFAYYVDDDFCLRCRLNNWKIFICKQAVLLHEEGRKEIKKFCGREFIFRNYSVYARYYISRNGIYMLKSYFKYFKYGDCLGVIGRHCSDMVKVILFEKSKGRMIRFILKGIWNGIMNKYGRLEIRNAHD